LVDEAKIKISFLNPPSFEQYAVFKREIKDGFLTPNNEQEVDSMFMILANKYGNLVDRKNTIEVKLPKVLNPQPRRFVADSVCQHVVLWKQLLTEVSTNDGLDRELIERVVEFIQRYVATDIVAENNLSNYCKSCNHILPTFDFNSILLKWQNMNILPRVDTQTYVSIVDEQKYAAYDEWKATYESLLGVLMKQKMFKSWRGVRFIDVCMVDNFVKQCLNLSILSNCLMQKIPDLVFVNANLDFANYNYFKNNSMIQEYDRSFAIGSMVVTCLLHIQESNIENLIIDFFTPDIMKMYKKMFRTLKNYRVFIGFGTLDRTFDIKEKDNLFRVIFYILMTMDEITVQNVEVVLFQLNVIFHYKNPTMKSVLRIQEFIPVDFTNTDILNLLQTYQANLRLSMFEIIPLLNFYELEMIKIPPSTPPKTDEFAAYRYDPYKLRVYRKELQAEYMSKKQHEKFKANHIPNTILRKNPIPIAPILISNQVEDELLETSQKSILDQLQTKNEYVMNFRVNKNQINKILTPITFKEHDFLELNQFETEFFNNSKLNTMNIIKLRYKEHNMVYYFTRPQFYFVGYNAYKQGEDIVQDVGLGLYGLEIKYGSEFIRNNIHNKLKFVDENQNYMIQNTMELLQTLLFIKYDKSHNNENINDTYNGMWIDPKLLSMQQNNKYHTIKLQQYLKDCSVIEALHKGSQKDIFFNIINKVYENNPDIDILSVFNLVVDRFMPVQFTVADHQYKYQLESGIFENIHMDTENTNGVVDEDATNQVDEDATNQVEYKIDEKNTDESYDVGEVDYDDEAYLKQSIRLNSTKAWSLDTMKDEPEYINLSELKVNELKLLDGIQEYDFPSNISCNDQVSVFSGYFTDEEESDFEYYD